MTLLVGGHQLAFSADKSANLNLMLEIIENSEANIDVFPEYAMGVPANGLSAEYVQKTAEPLNGTFVTQIMEQTRQKRSGAVFTMFLKEGKAVYNAAVFVDAGRHLALYKKIHLFDAFRYKESNLFTPGRKLAITEYKGFRVGLAVCFDLRFPELFRQMAYQGVSLFIIPSAWYCGEHKLEQWRVLVMARAHENTAFAVAINQPPPVFTGHSLGASPMGYTIQEAAEDRTSLLMALDLREIETARNLVPTLRLSKPDLYTTFADES